VLTVNGIKGCLHPWSDPSSGSVFSEPDGISPRRRPVFWRYQWL